MNDSLGTLITNTFKFYFLDSTVIETSQKLSTVTYVSETIDFSFKITNNESIPLNLTVLAFSADDKIVQGNETQFIVPPGESIVIDIRIIPQHASIHQAIIYIYLENGQLFYQLTLRYDVEPQWMSPAFTQAVILGVLFLCSGIIAGVALAFTLNKRRRYQKRITQVTMDLGQKGVLDLFKVAQSFSNKEWKRFQQQINLVGVPIGNQLVNSQYLQQIG